MKYSVYLTSYLTKNNFHLQYKIVSLRYFDKEGLVAVRSEDHKKHRHSSGKMQRF